MAMDRKHFHGSSPRRLMRRIATGLVKIRRAPVSSVLFIAGMLKSTVKVPNEDQEAGGVIFNYFIYHFTLDIAANNFQKVYTFRCLFL
jgi:hypothetical protein